MALNARRTADDEHSAIEHLQRPFHLGRKIHMSRCVKQRQRAAGQREDSLLGKDRDTSAAFLRVGVEKCIAVTTAHCRAYQLRQKFRPGKSAGYKRDCKAKGEHCKAAERSPRKAVFPSVPFPVRSLPFSVRFDLGEL